MAKRGPKGPLSDNTKLALARGRQEGRVVREYLDALRATKAGPGRKRTAETVTRRLAAVDDELRTADPVKELKLVQERFDLQAELEGFAAAVDIEILEKNFIAVAKGYSERGGISYAAWRAVGVEAGAESGGHLPRPVARLQQVSGQRVRARRRRRPA